MGKKRKTKETAAANSKTFVVAARQSSQTNKLNSHSAAAGTSNNSFTSFPAESLIFEKSRSSASSRREDGSQASSFASSSPLVELHPGAVWVIHDFLSPKECAAWIQFCETSGGLEYTSQPGNRYMAQRECYRMQQLDAVDVAEKLYSRLERSGVLQDLQSELVMFSKKRPPYRPVGFNPNIRVYKYTKGHAFGKHIDGSNKVPGMGNTEITILVYLSHCQGGATRFYPPGRSSRQSFAFDPNPGTMLLHVHGDNCLEHEADLVMDGTKYVLRTDMVFA